MPSARRFRSPEIKRRLLGMSEAQFDLFQLKVLEEELARRVAVDDVKVYGLPDLMRGPETPEEIADVEVFKARQNREMKEFVETRLWFMKGGMRRPVLNHQMVIAIADLLYKRVQKAIWWKPRGGGGSLGAAILIFLCMVFRKMSIMDMAGSGEQAKNVYEYVKQFWNCFPDMAQKLLKTEPLVTRTELVNGVKLQCISNSEKQSRGKHEQGLICDEACQRDKGSDQSFESAIQGTYSEPDFMVLLLSTFHHPIGIFQEYWDDYAEKGFARYTWNVYDTMQRCTIPDPANGVDPEDGIPLDCKKCPLTRKEQLQDDFGNVTEKWDGCNGRARESDGYQSFENVLEAKKSNKGSKAFEIEWECKRPDWRARIIGDDALDAMLVDGIEYDPIRCVFSVGIDWGLISQTAVLLGVQIDDPETEKPDYVGILEAEFMTGKLVKEVIELLLRWRETLGVDFEVFADSSHPFNNQELVDAGFNVTVVNFGKWKDYAYGNLLKYAVSRRLKIVRDLSILVAQLRGLKRDKIGKVIKKDDHGPDSLVSLLMRFDFSVLFPQYGDGQEGEDVSSRLF